jgi:hypothetical protein
MAHKLLLSWDFNGYVERGDMLEFKVIVENIGDTSFSGNFTSVRIQYPDVRGSVLTTLLPTVPNLLPQNPFETPTLKTYVMNHGLSWIHVTLEADDKQPIEYYQVKEGGMPSTEDWKYPFFVTSREDATVVKLLESIEAILKAKKNRSSAKPDSTEGQAEMETP